MSFLRWVRGSTEVEANQPVEYDFSNWKLLGLEELAAVVEEGSVSYLENAFTWHFTPQGRGYWSRIRKGLQPLTTEDIELLRAYLDYCDANDIR